MAPEKLKYIQRKRESFYGPQNVTICTEIFIFFVSHLYNDLQPYRGNKSLKKLTQFLRCVGKIFIFAIVGTDNDF